VDVHSVIRFWLDTIAPRNPDAFAPTSQTPSMEKSDTRSVKKSAILEHHFETPEIAGFFADLKSVPKLLGSCQQNSADQRSKLHPTNKNNSPIIQNEMSRILLNSKTIAGNFCEWRSQDPSACYRSIYAQDLCREKMQLTGKNRIGSLGKIRTSNPSVNSRMLYH
jgi:hypothetical protein